MCLITPYTDRIARMHESRCKIRINQIFVGDFFVVTSSVNVQELCNYFETKGIRSKVDKWWELLVSNEQYFKHWMYNDFFTTKHQFSKRIPPNLYIHSPHSIVLAAFDYEFICSVGLCEILIFVFETGRQLFVYFLSTITLQTKGKKKWFNKFFEFFSLQKKTE